MSNLAARARDYAINAHARINHLRKYTFQPYDVHLKGVADLVSMVTDDDEIIAAAWLHDTVEDTPATFEDIEREFGHGVSRLVMEMTDVSRPDDGNRSTRKEIDRDHTALASARAKTIKLADLIDNCSDICRHDPAFGAVYLQEMVDLLQVLHEGDQRLYRRALKVVAASAKKLKVPVPEASETSDYRGAGTTPLQRYAGGHGSRLFTSAFTARDILEPLLSYDAQRLKGELDAGPGGPTAEAIGVRRHGRITEYLLGEDVAAGRLMLRTIERQQQLALDAPLSTVIHVLTMFSCCFVTINGEPVGVITRRDMEKPVVRMWLFGIIMLIEMILGQLIRDRWPAEEWRAFLSEGRIEKAQELQQLRRERGVVADLFDCLQLSDKLVIAMQEPDFLESSAFLSNKAARRAIKELESLRNNLAHGQDITSQDWPPIARLAKRIQGMV